MEALPETLEGDEGLRREVPGAHVAEGLLEASGRTLAPEASHQQIETRPAVLTHALGTAARARRDLASLTCRTDGQSSSVQSEHRDTFYCSNVAFSQLTSYRSQLRFTEVSTLSQMFFS